MSRRIVYLKKKKQILIKFEEKSKETKKEINIQLMNLKAKLNKVIIIREDLMNLEKTLKTRERKQENQSIRKVREGLKKIGYKDSIMFQGGIMMI